MISSSGSRLRHAGRIVAPSLAVFVVLWAAPAASPLPLDDTPPVVQYSIFGIVGSNNWYRGSTSGNFVTVNWTVYDPDSPITSTTGCEPGVKIDGPNTGTTRTCSATSDGGTTQVTTKVIKIDADPPGVTATPGRPPNANGWYNAALTIDWNGSDVTSGLASCAPNSVYGGPDAGNAAVSGTCTDNAGNVGSKSFPLKYDSTPPTVSAAPDRPADSHGWYNHALAIRWQGSDATSGISGCTSMAYPGPDVTAASLSGGCTDRAGNTASAPFAFNYDATPPSLSSVRVESANGRNIVRWKSSTPADTAVVNRVARGSRKERRVFKGSGSSFADKTIRDGVEYRYVVRSYDEAANASAPRAVVALPKVVTLGSGYTPRTAALPVLDWSRVRGAAYYHVQLFRKGKRILAAWPLESQLALRARWTWAGRRYRLTPGRYSWYVWAGFGARAAARYHPIGHAFFVVPGG